MLSNRKKGRIIMQKFIFFLIVFLFSTNVWAQKVPSIRDVERIEDVEYITGDVTMFLMGTQ